MTLLTDTQMAAIRGYGELGMTTQASLRRYTGLTTPAYDEDPTPTYETSSSPLKCWVVSRMDRDFDEDGNRIVGVHDFTIRVPVGSNITSRDLLDFGGVTYTVVETNIEDTWPEWTEVYAKKIA